MSRNAGEHTFAKIIEAIGNEDVEWLGILVGIQLVSLTDGIQQALRTTLLDQNYTLGKTSQRHQHTCKNNK